MCPDTIFGFLFAQVNYRDNSNNDSPLAGDISSSVIPLLTSMARDSLKTRLAKRQVYRTPFFLEGVRVSGRLMVCACVQCRACAYRYLPRPRSVSRTAVEAEIHALSFHSRDSSEPEVWDAKGKTPEEIAAWCEEYERGNRRQMAKRRQ